MTQKDKELLLLKDLCGRLPYGVKVLYQGWDSDHGCEFDTVEDLIGIDDKFIHTLWRGERDKHSIVEPLSIIDYKPYLRPLSSMTEEEYNELKKISSYYGLAPFEDIHNWTPNYNLIDWLNRKMFDYRDLIQMGLALEAPKGMYTRKI